MPLSWRCKSQLGTICHWNEGAYRQVVDNIGKANIIFCRWFQQPMNQMDRQIYLNILSMKKYVQLMITSSNVVVWSSVSVMDSKLLLNCSLLPYGGPFEDASRQSNPFHNDAVTNTKRYGGTYAHHHGCRSVGGYPCHPVEITRWSKFASWQLRIASFVTMVVPYPIWLRR